MVLGEGKDIYGLVDLVDLSAYIWDKSAGKESFFSIPNLVLLSQCCMQYEQ